MSPRLPFVALLLLSTGVHAAEKGMPPITAQTALSGGPLDPTQKKVTLDTADLAIEVDPVREVINGTATLTFTARDRDRKSVV